ncbi:MAG: nuclear transport factor 2 family protein, partial [Pseudomarimonas sp.]
MILVLVSMCLASCGSPPDEEALRTSISAMQTAAEQRSLAGVMDHVTDDFGGSQGLDNDGLRRLLQAQIIANAAIGSTIGPITIERQGERATATFSLVLTGGSGRFV